MKEKYILIVKLIILLLIILALYVVVLLIAWGFFIVARMHTMKFKNFSTHIEPFTNYLMIFLIILSIAGFIFIFSLNLGKSTYEINVDKKIETNDKENNSFEEEIIGNDYY